MKSQVGFIWVSSIRENDGFFLTNFRGVIIFSSYVLVIQVSRSLHSKDSGSTKWQSIASSSKGDSTIVSIGMRTFSGSGKALNLQNDFSEPISIL